MIQASPEVMLILMDQSGGIDGRFYRMLQLMFTENFLEANPDFVARLKERYLRAPISDTNSLRQFIACAKSDTYERLSEIKNPTLVATGTDDRLIPPQNSQMLAQRIPGAKLVDYKGSGHGFMSQSRDIFIKDLFNFFR